MKKIFLVLSVLFSTFLNSNSQRIVEQTDYFEIRGHILHDYIVDKTEIDKYPSVPLEDMQLHNQEGEAKPRITGLRGVLLKDMLDKLEYDIEKPKDLNEFYFTLIASDGYRVVYSWNEIFNTETGNHIYIITEKNGQTFDQMDDKILIVCDTDFKKGRRHIKAVEEIIVNRTR